MTREVDQTITNLTRIAVYGGARCSEEIYKRSRTVGRLLAMEKVLVYCGGMTGVMEGVSHGVSEVNGTVVGILPESGCEGANRFVTVPVATGAGGARNVMIANSVQGAIAIDGEYGTLSEIAHTLRLGKPVVGLDTWSIEGVETVNTPEEAVTRILELV
ncbi:MAG: TIGR00725 family protein [Fidelibacterota bacterium]